MEAHAAFLREEVLLRSDAVPAMGLSLHLADIAVTELRGACEDGGTEAPVPGPALKVSVVTPLDGSACQEAKSFLRVFPLSACALLA